MSNISQLNTLFRKNICSYFIYCSERKYMTNARGRIVLICILQIEERSPYLGILREK